MRMKEVCERTGLTEKAVRLYIREGLVTPEVRAGVHSQAYHFSESDAARLRQIATLREAGFSLADIRQMQQHPEQVPDLLEERRALLGDEISQKQAVVAALERLTPAEQGDLTQAVRALRPAVESAKPEPRGSGWLATAAGIAVLGALVALSLYWMLFPYRQAGHGGAYETQIVVPAVLGFLFFVGAAVCLVMGVRYLTAPRRAARLPQRAVGRVAAVNKDTGFDASYARLGAAGAGGMEPGQGGIWQVWFMFWNEIRPDHWFPLIQYTDAAGKTRSGTFPYGGLKGSWQEGDVIEVGWDPKRPGLLLPLHAPWLARKGLAYLALAALLALGGGQLFRVLGAAIAPYLA